MNYKINFTLKFKLSKLIHYNKIKLKIWIYIKNLINKKKRKKFIILI